VKTLCAKLIKIDILLSHVKLNKLSIVTRPLEKKNFPKIHGKKNQVWSILIIVGGERSISEIHTIDTFSDIEAMPDVKKVTWSQWGHFTSLTNFSYA
jgi:hypothetical protein